MWFLDIVWSIMITDTRRWLLTMMWWLVGWWVMDQEAEGKEELSMKLRNVSLFPLFRCCCIVDGVVVTHVVVLFGVGTYYDHRYKKKTINRLTMMWCWSRSKKREELTGPKCLSSAENRRRENAKGALLFRRFAAIFAAMLSKSNSAISWITNKRDNAPVPAPVVP